MLFFWFSPLSLCAVVGVRSPCSMAARIGTVRFGDTAGRESEFLPHTHLRLMLVGELPFISLKGVTDKARTSFGMFLTTKERELPIVQAIEKRISVFSQIPVQNGEPIQVLRYEMNQYFLPHSDYFNDPFNLNRGGQRVATMLMYLSDDVEGGETFFPWAGERKCSCGGNIVKGMCVKLVKGDAVLLWNTELNGTEDSNRIHGGCEVLKGEKWSATKWMRQRVFI